MNYFRSKFTLLHYWKKITLDNYLRANMFHQRSFTSIKTPNGVLIRKLERQDVPQLVKSVLPPERWNLSENDINFALDVDPDGSVIALNEAGTIVGSKVAFNLDKDTDIGLVYWVSDEYERKGFGLTMRRMLIDHQLKRNFLILGISKTIEKYEIKDGLKKGDIVQRFFGKIKNSTNYEVNGVTIERFSLDLFEKIINYDYNLCLSTKSSLLKKYINHDQSLALLALKDSKLCGYGVIRDCIYAPKVEPLFADNANIAKLLLLNLFEQYHPAKEKGIWIELAIKNEEGVKIATSLGLICLRTLPYFYITDNSLAYHPKIYSRLLWQHLKH